MNDTLSLVLDCIIFILFVCVRMAAICYGVTGITTSQVELTVNGILLYLISNNFEKIMDERLKK